MAMVIVKFLGDVESVSHEGMSFVADAATRLCEMPSEFAKKLESLNCLKIFANDMAEADQFMKAEAEAAVEAAKAAVAKLKK